jgi:hypothetical protein
MQLGDAVIGRVALWYAAIYHTRRLAVGCFFHTLGIGYGFLVLLISYPFLLGIRYPVFSFMIIPYPLSLDMRELEH